MSSLAPATVNFSLEEFAKHGGLTGIHKDGWGIAFYEGNDIRLLREARAAGNSPLVRFVREHGFASKLVISHIRRATQGAIVLKNTQPFCRELSGRMHVFAHNGDLKGIHQDCPLGLGHFRPIGETDSEEAFCLLLAMMAEIWKGSAAPTLQQRLDVVSSFAKVIRRYGPANFIYSDGELLFAHGHKRTQPGGKIEPPGLYMLSRHCLQQQRANEYAADKIAGMSISPGAFSSDSQFQQVVLVASVPLTSEEWIPLEEGEIVVADSGTLLS